MPVAPKKDNELPTPLEVGRLYMVTGYHSPGLSFPALCVASDPIPPFYHRYIVIPLWPKNYPEKYTGVQKIERILDKWTYKSYVKCFKTIDDAVLEEEMKNDAAKFLRGTR